MKPRRKHLTARGLMRLIRMHRLMFANLENKREKNATRVVQNVSFSETMAPHPRYKLYIALKSERFLNSRSKTFD